MTTLKNSSSEKKEKIVLTWKIMTPRFGTNAAGRRGKKSTAGMQGMKVSKGVIASIFFFK